MASKKALERAAQAWQYPDTSQLVVIPLLAEGFARVLDEEWGTVGHADDGFQALRNAGELLGRLRALLDGRCSLSLEFGEFLSDTPEFLVQIRTLFKVRGTDVGRMTGLSENQLLKIPPSTLAEALAGDLTAFAEEKESEG